MLNGSEVNFFILIELDLQTFLISVSVVANANRFVIVAVKAGCGIKWEGLSLNTELIAKSPKWWNEIRIVHGSTTTASNNWMCSSITENKYHFGILFFEWERCVVLQKNGRLLNTFAGKLLMVFRGDIGAEVPWKRIIVEAIFNELLGDPVYSQIKLIHGEFARCEIFLNIFN